MIAKSRHERQHLGQYFTPPALAGAVWELLALFRSRGRSRALDAAGPVLEPAVGTGVFLLEGLERGVAAEAMVGVDVDPGLEPGWEVLARSHPGLTLVEADALRPHPALERPFEIVIGNPPFGSEGLYGLKKPESPEARALASALADYSIFQQPGRQKSLRQLATFPIEGLFIERCIQLCRQGGWIALILPEGLLANRRLQHVRRWTADRCAVRAVVALPGDVFRREKASARTVLLLLQKGAAAGETFLGAARTTSELADVLQEAAAYLVGGSVRRATLVAQAELADERWDPAYWSPELAAPLADLLRRFETRPLGDFLAHLTYGPVVTGRRPEGEPGDVWLLNQGELGLSGIDLTSARRVAAGSVFDPVRSRPRVGDLLFARSGAGSLGKGRMAVLSEPLQANVGCFVDVLRFERLDAYFAWLFLASRHGQGQIRRLINGVATPNLSFAEIRGLRIPLVPAADQAALGALYARDVLPLHRAYQAMPVSHPDRAAAKHAAHAAMQEAIARFEAGLEAFARTPTGA